VDILFGHSAGRSLVDIIVLNIYFLFNCELYANIKSRKVVVNKNDFLPCLDCGDGTHNGLRTAEGGLCWRPLPAMEATGGNGDMIERPPPDTGHFLLRLLWPFSGRREVANLPSALQWLQA
jgi:hypothetical protein